MPHPRPEKVAEVEALEQSLRSSTIVIVTDYRGLSVAEIRTLRSRLREASVEYRVAKNTLLSRAAEQAGVKGLGPFLNGPTAVVFGKDNPGLPARVLQEFIRQFRKLAIRGGVVDGQALDAAAVQALATLPTRVELLSLVAGMVQAPLRGLVTVLTGPQRALVTALDAVRKQREAREGPAKVAGTAQETAAQAAALVAEVAEQSEPVTIAQAPPEPDEPGAGQGGEPGPEQA